ncbi:ribonuclease H-like domain-containing protein [Rhizophagus clarus]|uniref:Ribonuclease H-like domain-containing protein n=1 Tax=Rhizophagus clarus TaxID=94130 RepID=A0A8H3LNC6_9GLOM|nr:ribonuclease H-like domain-containing protein [Rhizophagus clarus]
MIQDGIHIKTQAALKFLSAKLNPEHANIICTNGIPNVEVDKRSKKDTARLYEAVHCFAYTTKIFSEYHDPIFSEKMVSRMENRWKDWEHRLLLLSITLHPSYKGDDPYDNDQFQGNVLDFWKSTKGIEPELAKVATHIHSICVNSASVERLWSSMGFFHTDSWQEYATALYCNSVAADDDFDDFDKEQNIDEEDLIIVRDDDNDDDNKK